MAIELKVTRNKVTVTNQEELNQGEFNVTNCSFDFDPEYEELEKRAVFSNILGQKYLVYIENDTCIIPEKILSLPGKIKIGVYAYIEVDGKLQLRYSPTPTEVEIKQGSFIVNDDVVLDTADATATPDDILVGKTAYGKNQKIIGTIPTFTQIITPSTEVQYIEDGFHTDSYVEAVDDTIDDNIKPENIKEGVRILGVDGVFQGLIPQEKIINPTTTGQIITPDEGYTGLSKVTVNGVTSTIDSNIEAINIKEGVNILGVEGEVVELNGQTKTIAPSTLPQKITPDTGYNALTEVNIEAVTNSIDNNITPTNIKEGITILGVRGNVIEKNAQNIVVNPSIFPQTILPDSEYNSIEQVVVNPIPTENKIVKSSKQNQTILPTENKFIDRIIVEPIVLQDKEVNPSLIIQNITADNNFDGLNKVTINPIQLQAKEVTINENGTTTIEADQSYNGLGSVNVTVEGVLDTSDATATSSDMAEGVTAYVNGVKLTGNVLTPITFNQVILDIEKSDSSQSLKFRHLFKNSYFVKPYESTGIYWVYYSRIVEAINLQAGDIKEGVTYLGVTGTYKGLDTSDATAVASDIAEGKTAYVDGVKLTGTLQVVEPVVLPDGLKFGNEVSTSTDYSWLKNVDTSNMITMYRMFRGCSNATIIDVSNFNTSKVTGMGGMFENCYYVKNLDVSNFDTSNVTDLSSMFAQCNRLLSLDVSNFDTHNATNTYTMFNGCGQITSLDVSNFNLQKVVNANGMFSQCSLLENIDVSGFKLTIATAMSNMFLNCRSLSNNSLNSILAMCIDATSLASTNKTLKYIGLSQTQAETCQTLSNWDAFVAAGWSAGY